MQFQMTRPKQVRRADWGVCLGTTLAAIGLHVAAAWSSLSDALGSPMVWLGLSLAAAGRSGWLLLDARAGSGGATKTRACLQLLRGRWPS
jgi:hypothetical protein